MNPPSDADAPVITTAPTTIAAALGILTCDHVVRQQQLHHRRGLVRAVICSYLPWELAHMAGLDQPGADLRTLHPRLIEIGRAPAGQKEQSIQRPPTVPEAAQLGLTGSDPVTAIVRLTYDRAGRALECLHAVVAPPPRNPRGSVTVRAEQARRRRIPPARAEHPLPFLAPEDCRGRHV